MGKKLVIEYNQKYIPDLTVIVVLEQATILATPPINEDYWVVRVPLTENQAIVAFPKFTTYGVGFQVEEDWNTNLPFTCDAEQIYNHIKHNKGDKRITKARCIEAIELIQAALKEWVPDIWNNSRLRIENREKELAELARRRAEESE